LPVDKPTNGKSNPGKGGEEQSVSDTTPSIASSKISQAEQKVFATPTTFGHGCPTHNFMEEYHGINN
jgi:hypothetical protein